MHCMAFWVCECHSSYLYSIHTDINSHLCSPKQIAGTNSDNSPFCQVNFHHRILLLFWCTHSFIFSFLLIYYSQLYCSIKTPHLTTYWKDHRYFVLANFHDTLIRLTYKEKRYKETEVSYFYLSFSFFKIQFNSIHEQVSSDCWCWNFSIACIVWLTVSIAY